MTPEREYNLYLCNYRAYLGKRRLEDLIKQYEDQMPMGLLAKLIGIKDQIRLLHEVEYHA